MRLLPPWEDLIVSGCAWKNRKGRELGNPLSRLQCLSLSFSLTLARAHTLLHQWLNPVGVFSVSVYGESFRGDGGRGWDSTCFCCLSWLLAPPEFEPFWGSALQPGSLPLGISFHRFFWSFSLQHLFFHSSSTSLSFFLKQISTIFEVYIELVTYNTASVLCFSFLAARHVEI